jgi:hypothetical protein
MADISIFVRLLSRWRQWVSHDDVGRSNGDEIHDEIASRFFRETGRPVWRNIIEIPHSKPNHQNSNAAPTNRQPNSRQVVGCQTACYQCSTAISANTAPSTTIPTKPPMKT